MDAFFTYLKKSLVATTVIIFAFVVVYTPQHFNQVHEVEAGGIASCQGPCSNLFQQTLQTASQAAIKVSSAATAVGIQSIWSKEFLLDGLGWAFAKSIVSGMVRDLIDWVNSGFDGKPQFLSDFKGFMQNVVLEEFDRYVGELIDPDSFVCSPFRLDVALSVNIQYQQMQAQGGDGQPAPTCTLSGIINNIENFIGGTFTDGGFDDWFDITAQPSVYTPYGATLAAQADFQARVVNAKGEELTKLGWGDGFLSGSICNAIEGTSANPRQDCVISKPGQVISEALNSNLDSGRQSLIQADEINELIAALLNQLANKAIGGVNGLLGLGGAQGQFDYTDTDFSGYSGQDFIDQMVADQEGILTNSSGDAGSIIDNSLDTQAEYNNLAYEYLPQLELALLTTTDASAANRIAAAILEAEAVIDGTEGTAGSLGTIQVLEDLSSIYNAPGASTEEQQLALDAYNQTDNLYSVYDMEASRALWFELTQ